MKYFQLLVNYTSMISGRHVALSLSLLSVSCRFSSSSFALFLSHFSPKLLFSSFHYLSTSYPFHSF